MKSYGQFCPIAKAAEVITERWTILLLRDLLLGSHRFNDLRRGVPQMSPTLLVKRLQTLNDHGVINRVASADGHGWEYHITEAGKELQPLIELLGHWGQRWVRSQLSRDELDPGVLMWFIHRHFPHQKLPDRRVVMTIDITDGGRMRHWWLVVDRHGVDLCLEDPGYEVDVALTTNLVTLTRIYLGDMTFGAATQSGKLKVSGPRELTRALPTWFARSKFADVPSAT
jgi:DNA-binding HxlR family transcriptional regulator